MMILLLDLIGTVAKLVKEEHTQMITLIRWLRPGIFAKSRIRTNGEAAAVPSEAKIKNSSYGRLRLMSNRLMT